MIKLPKARTADLLEQEAGAELLIYDQRINKTYLLNETSKNTFSACAEGLSFDELKRRYNYSDDLIHFTLDKLRANGLIEGASTAYFAGLSRREVIKRVGLASMAALPVISALTAPIAANAASGCPDPSGSNIPSGCPVGDPVVSPNTTCANGGLIGKNNDCNALRGNSCQSGSARYISNSCSNTGTDSTFSCECV